MSGAVAGGIALATAAFGARAALRAWERYGPQVVKQLEAMQKSTAMKNYYRGGFEAQMSRREAGLVLGISPAADMKRVREAHRRIMLLNHPDRGGSPFLASKINEAKDILEGKKSSGQASH